MGYREEILGTSGLLGYWRFGESNPDSGVVAEYGLTGTFPTTRPDLNSAGVLVGDTNTCYRWASSNKDYIYWPGSNFTFANRAAFSIEIWYQPTTLAPSSGYMNLVSKDRYDASASGYGLYLSNVTKRLYFTRVSYQDGVTNLTGPIVSMDNWYHIVCTYDGNNMTMYVNNTQVGSTSSLTNMTANTSTNLNLGKSAEGNFDYLSAWMDEFALYNRALTPSEVDKHYDTALTPVVIEYGGASPVSTFDLFVLPQRRRTSRVESSMTSSTTYIVQREVQTTQSFPTTLSLDSSGNVSAFPSHSIAMTSSMEMSPIRSRTNTASATLDMPVTLRMPMIFQESHTFPIQSSALPSSAVLYTSNNPRFPVSSSLSLNGMTRIELDQLFKNVSERRSGAIHFATSRLTRESVSTQHPHSETLEPVTETLFVARNDEGTPKVAGTAIVEWYISRVVIDATNRVHDRPDVLEYFNIGSEVLG